MDNVSTRARIWTILLPFTAYLIFILAMIWILILLPYCTTPPHQDILIAMAPVPIIMLASGLHRLLPHENTLKFGFFFYAISICNAINYLSTSFLHRISVMHVFSFAINMHSSVKTIIQVIHIRYIWLGCCSADYQCCPTWSRRDLLFCHRGML